MGPLANEAFTNSSDQKEDEACVYAMQLSISCTFLKVLNTSIELGLLDIIHDLGGGTSDGVPAATAAAVAAQLPTKNPEAPSTIERMLRLLASYNVLGCSLRVLEDGRVERVYGIAPAGKYFLRNKEEGSLASILSLSCHPISWVVGRDMKDAVLEGGDQFQKVHGVPLFQYINTDPAYGKVFNNAMAEFSIIVMKKVLEIYKGFEGLTSLVDVGGGLGANLNMIIADYSLIQGINFDLPHVIQSAPSHPSIEHIGGNMFESVPPGEAIMIKWVLHNWSDKQCLTILKNCHKVLPVNGKVIVIDIVLPTVPDASSVDKYVSLADNLMLINKGGRERTEEEFEALCKASGFSEFKFACQAYTIGVMEFLK